MTTKQNVKTVPYISRMLLENDQVKVYETWLKPGEQNEYHCHPDYVVYNLTDNKINNIDSSGKGTEREYKAGQVDFLPEQSHSSENIGSTESRILIVELKKKSR